MKKNFNDIIENASLIEVNVDKLTLDELYTTRSTSVLLDHKQRATYQQTRRDLIKELDTALALGQRFRQPIVTALVDSKQVVIDGWLRVEVAQEFAHKAGADVIINAKCLGELTCADAFQYAQQANTEHGIRMNAEQMRHVQLRQHILENRSISSSRKLAKEFGVTSSATGAKIKKCLERIESHQTEIQRLMSQNDIEGAMSFIKQMIQNDLGLFDEEFTALGLPSVYKWAQAIDLSERADIDDGIDDEKRLRLDALNGLESWLRKNGGEYARWALNQIDKKAVGITVKRDYDAEAYTLKYEMDGGEF